MGLGGNRETEYISAGMRRVYCMKECRSRNSIGHLSNCGASCGERMNNTFVYSHVFLAAASQNMRSIDVSCFGGMSLAPDTSTCHRMHRHVLNSTLAASITNQNDNGYIRFSSNWCRIRANVIKRTISYIEVS